MQWQRRVTGKAATHGVTAVEYGLLIGLIGVIALVAITSVGSQVDQLFSRTNVALSGVAGAPTPFVPTAPCLGSGSQSFSTPGHPAELNGQPASAFELAVAADDAGCTFTITIDGAGGGGGEAQFGGHGGRVTFEFIPDVAGSFTVLVGQGGNFQFVQDPTAIAIGGGGAAGEYGTSGEDTAGGGGGASAIAFAGDVLAISGGGGGGNSTPDCPSGGTVAQPGGNAAVHVCGGPRAGNGGAGSTSSGAGGAGGNFTIDGGAGGSSSGGSSSGGSAQNGSDGQGNPARGVPVGGSGGQAVSAFLVSGGGGGASDPDAGGGGGGGYGGGGGGGGDGTIVHGSGGAGGGGFVRSDARLTVLSTGTAGNGGALETTGGNGGITVSW